MTLRRFFLIALIALLTALWALGPSEAELLSYLKRNLAQLQALYALHPLSFPVGFFFLYALLTSFIPVGIPLMLLGGAVFPFLLGSFLVCTGYSVGATANFLIARYLLGDALDARLLSIRTATQRDGWFYLFALRLIPVIPAQGVSFAMGATRLGIPAFFSATWLGDLPLSALLTYTGRRLMELEHGRDLLSGDLMLGFTLFGVILIAGKWWLAKRASAADALSSLSPSQPDS